MNTLTVNEIVKKVRTKIDEIAVNESEMMGTDSDNANLDTVIKSCIADAYRFVSLNADISLLEGKSLTSPGMTLGDDLVGRILLPSDFLRLVSVRLSSWISSPINVIEESSPEYRMQSNKYVCGSPKRPVAALSYTSSGRQIELFKAASKDDKLSVFVYIPALGSSFDSVDISSQAQEAFIYYTAALTLTTFREDIASEYFRIARNLLGIE